MKSIYLAPKGKRMLSRAIDMLILFGTSAILYFSAVYPNTFNQKRFTELNNEVTALYSDSQLYLTNKQNQFSAKTNFTSYINTINDLYDVTIYFNGVNYEHNCLSRDLFIYYTTLNQSYGGGADYTVEGYESTILKVGSIESNIASFNSSDFTFTLIDPNRSSTTLSFFLKAYENAAITVNTSSLIRDRNNESSQMIITTLLFIIPVVVGLSFIFDFIIPICSRDGRTIGKWIYHFGLVTYEGYRFPKWKHIIRWLAYVFELAIGIGTFLGGFLITYTMFLFSKKRRCLHDFIANSVVIDSENSIYFDNMKEEAFYINKIKGANNGSSSKD